MSCSMILLLDSDDEQCHIRKGGISENMMIIHHQLCNFFVTKYFVLIFQMIMIQVRPHTVTVRVKQRPAGPPEPVTNMAAKCSFFLNTWTYMAATYSFCSKLFPTWDLSITITLTAVILLRCLLTTPSWKNV